MIFQSISVNIELNCRIIEIIWLQTTIKITALLAYVIAIFAMAMGFMNDNPNYFMLMYVTINKSIKK